MQTWERTVRRQALEIEFEGALKRTTARSAKTSVLSAPASPSRKECWRWGSAVYSYDESDARARPDYRR